MARHFCRCMQNMRTLSWLCVLFSTIVALVVRFGQPASAVDSGFCEEIVAAVSNEYICKEYTVKTEDGFILVLHRLSALVRGSTQEARQYKVVSASTRMASGPSDPNLSRSEQQIPSTTETVGGGRELNSGVEQPYGSAFRLDRYPDHPYTRKESRPYQYFTGRRYLELSKHIKMDCPNSLPSTRCSRRLQKEDFQWPLWRDRNDASSPVLAYDSSFPLPMAQRSSTSIEEPSKIPLVQNIASRLAIEPNNPLPLQSALTSTIIKRGVYDINKGQNVTLQLLKSTADPSRTLSAEYGAKSSLGTEESFGAGRFQARPVIAANARVDRVIIRDLKTEDPSPSSSADKNIYEIFTPSFQFPVQSPLGRTLGGDYLAPSFPVQESSSTHDIDWPHLTSSPELEPNEALTPSSLGSTATWSIQAISSNVDSPSPASAPERPDVYETHAPTISPVVSVSGPNSGPTRARSHWSPSPVPSMNFIPDPSSSAPDIDSPLAKGPGRDVSESLAPRTAPAAAPLANDPGRNTNEGAPPVPSSTTLTEVQGPGPVSTNTQLPFSPTVAPSGNTVQQPPASVPEETVMAPMSDPITVTFSPSNTPNEAPVPSPDTMKSSPAPVLLMHQEFLSGASWFIKTEKIAGELEDKLFPFSLVDSGYDVWIGHHRATFWGHDHTFLTHDDQEYWAWTWDEHAQFDIPALLGFIIQKTESSVHLISVSQSAAAVAAAATMPEVVKSIKSLTLIGPTVYTGDTRSKVLESWAYLLGRSLDQVYYETGFQHGAFNFSTAFPSYMTKVVGQGPMAAALSTISGPNCCLGSTVVSLNNGWDGTTSFKNLLHIQQGIRNNTWRKFDYGNYRDNTAVYGTKSPPTYYPAEIASNLRILVVYGGKDSTAPPDGVRRFMSQLSVPPAAVYLSQYAHADMFFSKNRADDIYAPITDFLNFVDQAI